MLFHFRLQKSQQLVEAEIIDIIKYNAIDFFWNFIAGESNSMVNTREFLFI